MSTQNTENMEVADGLFIRKVQASSLREQDINAQKMDPTKFQRLVDNVKLRGGLESLPYCHQPDGEGPISIISGHHRAKAARVAGLTEFPVLLDTKPMPRSLIRAKQIAHNELTGSHDDEILRQMISEIDNVDDMLISGLDENYLPEVEGDNVSLQLPHADFDWRMATFTFLPKHMDDFEQMLDSIDRNSQMIGVAPLEQFEEFSTALIKYGHTRNIKNMSIALQEITRIAVREVENHENAQAGTDGDNETSNPDNE